tara:strand:- start:185 stop:490 length:306 start_codon:yes stop_codon:yes gene_type:complete
VTCFVSFVSNLGGDNCAKPPHWPIVGKVIPHFSQLSEKYAAVFLPPVLEKAKLLLKKVDPKRKKTQPSTTKDGNILWEYVAESCGILNCHLPKKRLQNTLA